MAAASSECASLDILSLGVGDRSFGALRQHIAFDAIAVGILDAKRPQADELLYLDGWPQQLLLDWMGGGATSHALLAKARRRGAATACADELTSSDLLGQHQHLMAHALPAAPRQRGWWCVLFGRQSQPFTRHEQQIAALMVRCWQVGFDHIDERGMGRLLIGRDDRLIHADPLTRLHLIKQGNMLKQLVQSLHPVVEQRWPCLGNSQLHDFNLDLGDRRRWVRFCRTHAVNVTGGEHWYVELRDLTEDDPPAVGAVDDLRIAAALAYLHDQFDKSPSLHDVASAVHVSPFHFHRLFSRVVGISPKQYLQRLQLQMAKWLLTSSRLQIGAIAGSTGFASHGHFTSTFHRMVGVSPRAFREGNGNNHR